jgi:cytochrome c oxidase assembly factor CtaG
MAKMLIVFLSLFIIFFVSIDLFRKFTGKEKWAVIKTVSYSLAIAVLVVLALTGFVLVF